MIKLGKVNDNLMVDVQPLNKKLVNRGKRVIQYAIGCFDKKSEELLQLLNKEGGVVHQAIALYGVPNVENRG
jgi:N-acetylmuramic acid 6-phosphate etherase